MANNRVSVVVDIKAQADNLNQIINQSKKNLQTLSPNMDPKQANNLMRQFDTLQSKIEATKNKLASGLNTQAAFTKASQDINRFGQDYTSIIQKIQDMGIDPKKIIPKTAEVEAEMKKLTGLYEKQGKIAGQKYGQGITKELNKELRKAAQSGDTKGVQDIGKKAANDLTAKNRSLIAQRGQITKFYGQDAEKKIEAELANQRNILATQGQGAQKAQAQKFGKNIGQLEADLKVINQHKAYQQNHQAIVQSTQAYAQQATQLNSLQIEIDETTGKISIMAKPARDEAAQALNQLGNSSQQAKTQIDSMNGSLDRGQQELTELSQKAKSMQQLKSYMSYFFSIGSMINYTSRAIRGMIKDFKELDKQFNEISIVTGKSMEEMWNTFSSVNQMAQEYGVTTKDVVSVQKLYYQQGRKTAEVTQLTNETLKFAKISGLEFGKATEYMTATLNAYNLEAEDANRITDTFSALAASAAADASEISVAMSKVASLSAMSGATMEETAAYLTKIIETTREGAETAGTAVKTIEARFTAINKLTDEQSELLEPDFNFNTIEKALKTVGVAVKDSTGNMRSFTDILNDLGPKWDDLTSNQQHYIATQAAGARQQSRFIALMNDWGRTAELVGIANESAGTGNRQLALSLDSIETELNKLKANWQEFYTTFIQSDWVKGIVSGLNSILEVLTKIASLDFGGWILLGLAIVLKAIISTAIKAGKTFLTSFKTSFNAARKPVEAAEDAEGVIRHYNKGLREGAAYAKGYNTGSGGKAFIGPQPYMGQNLVGMSGTVGTKAAGAAGAGAKAGGAVGGAFKAIGGFLTGTVGTIIGAVLAVSTIFVLLDRLSDSIINKRVEEKAKEIVDAQNKISETINNTKKATSSYTKALELHQKGLLRTKDETEEYQQALRNLQEEIPQLVNTLEDGTLKLNTATSAYQEYLERQENIVSKYNQAYLGADMVIGQGVLLSQEGQIAQKNIQSVAGSLSGMDEDSLKNLGLTGIDKEELGILAEKGLTREVVNEILNAWNQGDYDAEEFNELLKRYKETGSVSDGDFAWESYDTGWNWLLGIPGLTGAGTKEEDFQNLLDTLNELAGYDVVQKLIEANDPDAIRKVQVTNWADMKDAEKGTTTSEYTESAFSELLKRSNFDSDKFYVGRAYEEFGYNLFGSGTRYTEKGNKFISELYEENKDEYDNINILTPEGREEYLKSHLAHGTMTVYGGNYNSFEALSPMTEVIMYAKHNNIPLETQEDIKKIAEQIPESTHYENEGYFFNNPYTFKKDKEATEQFFKDLEDYGSRLTHDYTQVMNRYYDQNTTASLNNVEEMYKRLTSTATMQELKTLSESNIDAEGLEKLGFSNASKETIMIINSAIDQAWKEVSEKQDEFLDTLEAATGDRPPDLLGFSVEQMDTYLSQVKRVATEYGQTTAKAFWDKYSEYNNTKLNEIPEEFRSAFAQVDFTDASSISSYTAKLLNSFTEGKEKAEDFFDVVNEGVNIADITFKDAATQLDSLTTSLEKIKKVVDSINDKDGALSFEDAANLVQNTSLSVEDFTATSEGLVLSEENRIKAMRETLQLKYYELAVEEALMAKELDRLDFQAQKNLEEYTRLKNKTKLTEDEFNTIVELEEAMEKDPTLAQLAAKKESLQASQDMLTLAKKEMEVMTYYVDEVQEKAIKKLEKVIDLLGKIDEYADVDNLIQTLEQNLGNQDFYIEFTSNADVFAKNVKDKFNTLNNLISANLAKSQHAEKNVATMQENFAKNWGQYVTFDEYGNLMQDEAALIDWAKKIGNMDTSTKEGELKQKSEEAQFELLMEQIDAYREEHKLIQECADAANQHLQEVEALTKELRENVVELEDKFFDLFVERDEEILENLEERYDKMKEMDDEYLETVREAVEEERRLRDQNKAYEDVAQMERKLALLQMGGGSAVEIQKLQEEIKQARQDIADTEQDNILEGIEKENEKRAEAMDEEVEYQRAVLDQKKEDRRLYNEEIKLLMKQDKETIMNTWKALDKEWQASTEINKILMEKDMDDLVFKGQESANQLADTEIQKIEDAYIDVKESGVDELDSAMDTYVSTVSSSSGGVVSDIKTIETAYIGVKSVVDSIIEQQDKLLSSEKLKEIKKIILDGKLPDNMDPDAKGDRMKYDKSTIGTNQKIDDTVINSEGDTMYRIGDFLYSKNEISGTKEIGKSVKIKSYRDKKEGESYHADVPWLHDKVLSAKNENYVNAYAHNSNGFYDIHEGAFPDDEFRIEGYVPWEETKDLDGGKRLYKTSLSSGAGGNYYIDQTDLNQILGFDTSAQLYKLFNIPRLTAYATGGIVDYTGPAWVDGTKSRPEAFLSANDTQLIASLRDILRAGVSPTAFASSSIQKSGDTYYTIHINVDELGDGYSVDDLVEEMEERILQATGQSNVVKITR